MPVGLLDATDGGSAFALVAPALAAAHGADLVEKRLTLDRSAQGPRLRPRRSSPEDFYRMVELLRQAERARGDGFGQESARRARAGARALDRGRRRSSAAATS